MYTLKIYIIIWWIFNIQFLSTYRRVQKFIHHTRRKRKNKDMLSTACWHYASYNLLYFFWRKRFSFFSNTSFTRLSNMKRLATKYLAPPHIQLFHQQEKKSRLKKGHWTNVPERTRQKKRKSGTKDFRNLWTFPLSPPAALPLHSLFQCWFPSFIFRIMHTMFSEEYSLMLWT